MSFDAPSSTPPPLRSMSASRRVLLHACVRKHVEETHGHACDDGRVYLYTMRHDGQSRPGEGGTRHSFRSTGDNSATSFELSDGELNALCNDGAELFTYVDEGEA